MSFRGNLFKSLWIVPIDPSPTYTPHKLCDEVGERKWRARQKNNLCGSIRCSCSDGGRVQSEDGKGKKALSFASEKQTNFWWKISMQLAMLSSIAEQQREAIMRVFIGGEISIAHESAQGPWTNRTLFDFENNLPRWERRVRGCFETSFCYFY